MAILAECYGPLKDVFGTGGKSMYFEIPSERSVVVCLRQAAFRALIAVAMANRCFDLEDFGFLHSAPPFLTLKWRWALS